MDQARIEQLERDVRELTRRLAILERPATPEPEPTPMPEPPPPPPPSFDPPAWRTAPPPRQARPLREVLDLPQAASLEDLLGGRVLAWVGGFAVLLGIVFLSAVAVSHGWIGEGARTALAALASTGLLGLGIWLHERRARTDAALAAVATGVSGMFVTITVATQVYELVPSLAGTLLAVLVGAIATALAVRWESRGIAALGILGALAAPLLAGAGHEGGTVAILLVALAAAGGVLIWQRWDWLALAAFALSAPQWIAYLFDGASPATALLTLVGFGAVGVVVAVGHDLRVGARSLRVQGAFLLALNAIALGTAGWLALDSMGYAGIGKLWLAVLAVVHVCVGMASRRSNRVSEELGLLSLVLGVVLADVAYGLFAHGPALAMGWAATGVGFAVLLRRMARGGRSGELTGAGLGGHVALTLVSALTVDGPARVLAHGGTVSAACAASMAALAAGCLVSARVASERSPEWRVVLDVVGLGAVATLTALTLDGQALVFAWVGEVLALTAIARRLDDRVAGWSAVGFLGLAGAHVLALDVPVELPIAGTVATLLPVAAVAVAALAAARALPGVLMSDDPLPLRLALDAIGLGAVAYLTMLAVGGELLVVALAAEAAILAIVSRARQDSPSGWAALPFLGLGAIHALSFEAQPFSLVTGLPDPVAAVIAVGALAAAALVASEEMARMHEQLTPALRTAAAVALLYLASGLVVTPFESGNAVDSALLSAHQQGQMVLSVFWALVGVGTLVVGLRRDLQALRLAALALLGLTVVKVFLFDLATLTSIYRVVSFIGLGLLLLVGAYVWQRLRPRALPDLRETPEGLR